MLKPRALPRCIWDAACHTVDHDGIEHAGYLAFLGLLSLFPFLVMLMAILGVIGQTQTSATFITGVLAKLPAHVVTGLKPRIVEIVSGPPQGLLTVSILGALWTSSSAVEGLRTVLNRAYRVATPPAYWFRRTLSLLQLVLFAFVLTTGMFLLVAIPVALRGLGSWLGIEFMASDETRWSYAIIAFSLLAMWLAVACIYYIIPNIRQRFVSVIPGAAVVVALWTGALRLFTLYLENFHQMTLIYGSLGGIIAALVFFYICNIIFIFGAELNFQIARATGGAMEEREHVTQN